MKHVLPGIWGLMTAAIAMGQTGAVLDFSKISQTSGNLNAELANHGGFGFVSATAYGSLSAAAPFAGNGEVHLITLDDQGEVAHEELVRASDFDFFDEVEGAEFGSSLVAMGDVNGDGIGDFMVGAPGVDDCGALMLLLSHADGYQLQALDIPEGQCLAGDRWGAHLTREGSFFYVGLQSGTGRVLRFSINAQAQLNIDMEYGPSQPELTALLSEGDRFGTGVTLGDLNGDGHPDIVCGAPGDDDGGPNYGAIYQVLLDGNGSITEVIKVSTHSGFFTGFLSSNDDFGISIAILGDLDQDGVVDLAVGAPGDDDGNIDVGAVWILFLRENGNVKRHRKISLQQGNFQHSGLTQSDHFGTRLDAIGDLNGDGTMDLVVGAPGKNDGGPNRGAFYTIFVEYCEAPVATFAYEAQGTTVHFSIPGADGLTYLWNFSDGGFSQEQNPTHTFSSPGTYLVCLTLQGLCDGNHYCTNVTVQSTLSASSGEERDWKLYPNPSQGMVRVESSSVLERVSISDLTGKLVFQQGAQGRKELSIDLSHLSGGLYLVEMGVNGQRYIEKLVLK